MTAEVDHWFSTLARQNFAYRDLIGQDKWESWTPTRMGWTDVGTPTVTGRFRVVGRQCFFQVKVVPGTTVATVAGTSYITMPIAIASFGGVAVMYNYSTGVAVGVCSVWDGTNPGVFVPAQVATGNTLVIAGWYEI